LRGFYDFIEVGCGARGGSGRAREGRVHALTLERFLDAWWCILEARAQKCLQLIRR
jgi:hypothetical protein